MTPEPAGPTSSAAPASERFVVDQPGGNVALDLFVLDQLLGSLLDQELRPTGVTAAVYAVYSQLEQGSCTPGQLTSRLGLRPATLSGYVAGMERVGHVERIRSASDGRSVHLELTPDGRAKHDECRRIMSGVIASVHAGIGTSEDVENVRLALAVIARALAAVQE